MANRKKRENLSKAIAEGFGPSSRITPDESAVCVSFCAALAGYEGGSDSEGWFLTQFPRFGALETRQFAIFVAVIAESPEKTFHKSALEVSGLRWGQVYGMMKAEPRFEALYKLAVDSRQQLVSAMLMERVIASSETDCAKVTKETDAKGKLVKTITTTDPRTLLDVLSRFDRARFGDCKADPGGKAGSGGLQLHIDRVPREKIVEARSTGALTEGK